MSPRRKKPAPTKRRRSALERARSEGKTQYRESDWPPNLNRYTRGGSFFFERNISGRKFRKGLGTNPEAAKIEAQRLGYEISLHGPKVFQTDGTRGVTVAQVFADFRTTVAHRTDKTRASYRNRTSQFETYLYESHSGLVRIEQVTPQIAEGYFEWRSRQQVTRSGKARPGTPTSNPKYRTMKDDLTALRHIFAWAVRQGNIPSNPFDGIRIPRSPRDASKQPQPLSADEITKLLGAATEYDAQAGVPGHPSTFRGMMRDMIRLYLLTGLRKQELVLLPWQHVDLEWGEYGSIRVVPYTIPVVPRITLDSDPARKLDKIAAKLRRGDRLFSSRARMRGIVPWHYAKQDPESLMRLRKTAWHSETKTLHVETQKTFSPKATADSVPLELDANRLLRKRQALVADRSPFVFPHPDGGWLRSDFHAQFKKLIRQVRLRDDIRVHDLRHTFGFTLRERGASLETIKGLMRHADLKDTLIYAKYTATEGARATRKLSGYAGQ